MVKKKKEWTAPSHSAEVRRINRMIGQLEGVKRMIEDQRYCPDILSQTRAVSAAVRGLEASILERHLRHCVREAMNSSDEEEKISELLDLFKKRLPS